LQQTSNPNVILLHGDDSFEMKKHSDALFSGMGDPCMADLNTVRLDARMASKDEIKTACNTLPFLGSQRLVILENPLQKMQGDEGKRYFEAVLDHLPPTTVLVLKIEDTRERKKWRLLPSSHWLHSWMKKVGDRSRYIPCSMPESGEMPGWIIKETTRKNGQIARSAAVALAGMTGNDTRMAAQEIEKLLTYANFERRIETADVEQISASVNQSSIFDLVDSIASGNKSEAFRLLHSLLEEQDGLSLFAMITRQFRLLVQAREIMDEGSSDAVIQSELSLHPYVAQKLAGQSRRFILKDLENDYRALLQIDTAVKTGQMDIVLALDTFIASLGGR